MASHRAIMKKTVANECSPPERDWMFFVAWCTLNLKNIKIANTYKTILTNTIYSSIYYVIYQILRQICDTLQTQASKMTSPEPFESLDEKKPLSINNITIISL